MSSKRSISAVPDGAGAQEEAPDKKKTAANLKLPDYIIEDSPIFSPDALNWPAFSVPPPVVRTVADALQTYRACNFWLVNPPDQLRDFCRQHAEDVRMDYAAKPWRLSKELESELHFISGSLSGVVTHCCLYKSTSLLNWRHRQGNKFSLCHVKLAASHGCVPVLELLLDNMEPLPFVDDEPDWLSDCASEAISHGHVEAALLFVDRGIVSIEYIFTGAVCSQGNPDVVKALLPRLLVACPDYLDACFTTDAYPTLDGHDITFVSAGAQVLLDAGARVPSIGEAMLKTPRCCLLFLARKNLLRRTDGEEDLDLWQELLQRRERGGLDAFCTFVPLLHRAGLFRGHPRAEHMVACMHIHPHDLSALCEYGGCITPEMTLQAVKNADENQLRHLVCAQPDAALVWGSGAILDEIVKNLCVIQKDRNRVIAAAVRWGLPATRETVQSLLRHATGVYGLGQHLRELSSRGAPFSRGWIGKSFAFPFHDAKLWTTLIPPEHDEAADLVSWLFARDWKSVAKKLPLAYSRVWPREHFDDVFFQETVVSDYQFMHERGCRFPEVCKSLCFV